MVWLTFVGEIEASVSISVSFITQKTTFRGVSHERGGDWGEDLFHITLNNKNKNETIVKRKNNQVFETYWMHLCASDEDLVHQDVK